MQPDVWLFFWFLIDAKSVPEHNPNCVKNATVGSINGGYMRRANRYIYMAEVNGEKMKY